jgi:hypothetical protein
MDVSINLSCTNGIYKHLHHGKWCQNLFVENFGTKKNFKFFSTTPIFITVCHDKNAICDSVIFKKKIGMMTWHGIPHHINLGPHVSMSFKIKNYLVQHVTIQNDLKKFH